MTRLTQPLTASLLLAAFVVATTGCGGIPIRIVEDEKKQAMAAPGAFDDAIYNASMAVNEGELEQARQHVGDAESLAVTEAHHRKVRSMYNLIDGADALMQGNGAAAGRFWSRIEDPALRAEVRAKARAHQINVPDTVVQ